MNINLATRMEMVIVLHFDHTVNMTLSLLTP